MINVFIFALFVVTYTIGMVMISYYEKASPCIAWEKREVTTYPNIAMVATIPAIAMIPVTKIEDVCVKKK